MQKIKTWTKDHWRLLFKSAADNHMRIQQCHEGTDGSLRCDIRFSSYLELKKYQKKFRRVTVSLSGAIAMMLVAFVISPYVMNPNRSSASNYSWTQSVWGTETAGSVIAKGGTETTYDSKDGGIDASTGTEVKLKKATDKTETDDAHFSAVGTNGANTDVSTLAGTLKPKRTNAALCGNTTNHDGECVSGNCDTNFADTNKYCHATATSCADFTTGLAEQVNGYEKCSGNSWYKSCASGIWGASVNNPDTADDYCQGTGVPGTCNTTTGTDCGGFDLLATCASGTSGGFTNPGCQNCATGYLASSKTACHSSSSNLPANDTDCWSSYHHYASTCQSDLNGGCSDVSQCVSGATCTGNVCIPPFICGVDTVAYGGITYQTVLALDNKCWLKSNLGTATVATAFNTAASYGWLYQWGRLTDGHQISTSLTTTTQSSTDTPVDGKFITASAAPYDWRNPQNVNLWQGVSGINNPCPTGWRLPTQPEWSAVVTAEGITNYTTAASSNLKLPAAGNRSYTGTLFSQGSYGFYWSSSPGSTYAYYLYFNSAGVDPAYGGNRAVGMSVRCIKD